MIDPPTEPEVNLLPQGGEVHYHRRVFTEKEAEAFYDRLMQDVPWRHDEVKMFGKTIVTARKVACFRNDYFSQASECRSGIFGAASFVSSVCPQVCEEVQNSEWNELSIFA